MLSSLKPYSFRINSYCQRVAQKIINRVPSVVVSSDRAINNIKWIGKHISSPQNRLILGASALLSQPFIDLNNKRVDEDTRKTSALRTLAKIIAGTTTGYLVRYGTIKVIESMTKIPKKGSNSKPWETFFTPDRTRVAYKSLRQYKLAIGSLMALGVMVFTNFLIDAPLTKLLTNKFIALYGSKNKDNINNTYQPAVHISDLLNRKNMNKEVLNA